MKILLAVLALTISALPLCAQTLRYDEPAPDQVRIATLTDEEFAKLSALSDAREKALKAYFAARDEYASTKVKLEDKYSAHTEPANCSSGRTDVEWKGKFIIVEKYPTSAYGGNVVGWGGCGGNIVVPYTTAPSTTYVIPGSGSSSGTFLDGIATPLNLVTR